MSDNIPMDIQVEIMKRLPVKSLVRFRSLSKSWKSLIGSPDFVASYSSQVQHLCVDPDYRFCYKDKNYFLIVDDDTFPQHKVSAPFPQQVFKYPKICCCSNGLLCFSGFFKVVHFGRVSIGKMVVLWNPSIRKSVVVAVPHEDSPIYKFNIGFGVCRENMDPKIVKIRYIIHWDDVESIASIPWHVEVFTLSTGAWRSSCSNLPRKSLQFYRSQRVLEVDGFLYWLATDRIAADGGFTDYNLIVSFDLTNEEFTDLKIPDSLAYGENIDSLSMYKLRESLVIVHARWHRGSCHLYTVWTMEDGFPKSFTKPFDIKTPVENLRGFRTGGEPIIEIDDSDCVQLAVYDPQSKQIDNLGIDVDPHTKQFDNLRIHGVRRGFQVYAYMETMLLLDHPGSVFYSGV